MSRRNTAGAGTSEERAGGEFPPAASAVLAPSQNTVEDKKPVLTFAEVDKVDALERTDKPVRERMADWLNEAVGSPLYVLNASQHGWYRLGGRLRFAVTRYYRHKQIAIDFPRSQQEVEVVKQKRDVLRTLGIVYVAILPGESLEVEKVIARIDEEREAMLKAVPPKARVAQNPLAVGA